MLERVLRHLVVTLVVAATLGTAGAQELSLAEADAMEAKIMRIAAAAEAPQPAGAPPLRTSFTEREINAYLQHYGPTFLPAGIARPQVAIGDGGGIVARAIVDLDAVRRSRERSLFDPLAYLTGAVEVVTAGTVTGTDGVGIIHLESATVAGVAVPQTVAQELLRFYTRSPERPSGFEFDKPFELPANIRAVSVARGAATVVQ